MTVYKIGLGHDVPTIDLDPIVPQPKGDPVAPVERTYGASGVHHDRGGYVRYHWDFINSPAEYQTLLNFFGVNSDDTAEVTVIARNDRFYDRKYNGIAHRPEPLVEVKWEGFFIRDLDIYVTDLEEIV